MTNKSAKTNITDNFSIDREINDYLWQDMISMESSVVDSFFHLTKKRIFSDIVEQYQNMTIEDFLKLFP